MTYAHLVASVAGIIAGLSAGFLSLCVARYLGECRFWSSLITIANSLLRTEDNAHFFREYMRLFPLLVRYVARSTAILVVGLSPIAVSFIGLTSVQGQLFGANVNSTQVDKMQVATTQSPPADAGRPLVRAGLFVSKEKSTRTPLSDWEFDYLSAASMTSVFGLILMKLQSKNFGTG
jgi:hypothetical protein